MTKKNALFLAGGLVAAAAGAGLFFLPEAVKATPETAPIVVAQAAPAPVPPAAPAAPTAPQTGASPFTPAAQKTESKTDVTKSAVDAAAKAQQPYVPPSLVTKPLPESNEILPPLYGWTRVIMHDMKMPESDEIINNCGMKRDMIFQFFAQRLQDGGVPIVSLDQAARLVPDVVTVEAEPSITSMQDLVINCISYVNFRVKMELTFRVPPMMYRRTVPVYLWNDGTMVSSAKSTHNAALTNAFIMLAERFRDAWRKQNGAVDPASLR